jgi:hypothetical protein
MVAPERRTPNAMGRLCTRRVTPRRVRLQRQTDAFLFRVRRTRVTHGRFLVVGLEDSLGHSDTSTSSERSELVGGARTKAGNRTAADWVQGWRRERESVSAPYFTRLERLGLGRGGSVVSEQRQVAQK